MAELKHFSALDMVRHPYLCGCLKTKTRYICTEPRYAGPMLSWALGTQTERAEPAPHTGLRGSISFSEMKTVMVSTPRPAVRIKQDNHA